MTGKSDSKNPESENQTEKIELQPFYHDLRNEIVQPKNIIVETKYFWDGWKARLGPTLTVIIMELRRRCYYNSKTGERRDYCWPSLKFLAEACGISIRTIQRELKRPEAKLFVRIEPRFDGKRQTSNIYFVAMDDPLLPEDKERLKKRIDEAKTEESQSSRGGSQIVRGEGDKLSGGEGDKLSPHEDIRNRRHTKKKTTTDEKIVVDSQKALLSVRQSKIGGKENTDSSHTEDEKRESAKDLASQWNQVVVDFRLFDDNSSTDKYFLSLLEDYSYEKVISQLSNARIHFSSNGKEKIKNLRGWFRASLDEGWNLLPKSEGNPLATDWEEIEATREEAQERREEWERELEEERRKTPEERAEGRLSIHKTVLKMKGKTLAFQEERELREEYINQYREEEAVMI